MKWAFVFFVEFVDVAHGVSLVDEKPHCVTVARLKSGKLPMTRYISWTCTAKSSGVLSSSSFCLSRVFNFVLLLSSADLVPSFTSSSCTLILIDGV